MYVSLLCERNWVLSKAGKGEEEDLKYDGNMLICKLFS